jgi:Alkyl sulfatase dimerisation
VRTIWRLYGGWWDGNPATLKPAAERTLALELAELAGGAAVLADRALDLVEGATPAALTEGKGEGKGPSDDNLRLAGHLAELAWLAAPEDPAIGEAHRIVFTRRADAATSTMAKGVFSWAARPEGGGLPDKAS